MLSTTGDLSLTSTNSWHRNWISGETASIDGALADDKGVVGVAKDAQVVSLKVFDSSGGGDQQQRLDKSKVMLK